jgi:hypothetical protein
MSGSVVYLDDINMNFSIMDVLQGKCIIYVSNPSFTAPGAPVFNDTYYFKKNMKQSMSKGTIYHGPKIYYLRDNKIYSDKCQICVTPNRNSKANFTFYKPYDTEASPKVNYPVMVGFEDKSISDKLIVLDQRFNMILDILISANLFNMDLKPFANMTNEQFFVAFNKAIADAQKKKNPMVDDPAVFSPKAYDMWHIPYVYGKINNNPVILHPNDHKESFSAVRKNPGNFIVKTLFSMLLENDFTMDGFTTATALFTPYNKNVVKQNMKTKDWVIYPNHKLRFKIKLPGSKVPSALISKILRRGNQSVEITSENLPTLWGGVASRMQKYTGFILVNISYDLNVYSLGSSYVAWTANSYNGKAISGSANVPREDELPDMDDSDDDGDGDSELTTSGKSNVGTLDIDDADI